MEMKAACSMRDQPRLLKIEHDCYVVGHGERFLFALSYYEVVGIDNNLVHEISGSATEVFDKEESEIWH